MTVINIITMLVKIVKGVNNMKLAYDIIIIMSNDTTMISKMTMNPLLMRMTSTITTNKRRMTT